MTILIILYYQLLIGLMNGQDNKECTKSKPFRMIDRTCVNFAEICIKSEDDTCKTLLLSCEQCPSTTITGPLLWSTLNTILTDQNTSKNNLEKSFENLKNEIKFLKLDMKSRTSTKQDGLILLLWIIIILLILLFVILLLEIRFKIITKFCEKCTNKGRKRNYRMVKCEKYKSIIDSKTKHQSDNVCQLPNNDYSIILSDIVAKLDKLFENKKGVIINFLINFPNNLLTESIELYVNNDDNVVKIKKQICAKCNKARCNDYKIMKLEYNGRIIDDNNYLLKYVDSSNGTVTCRIDNQINPNEIIILKVGGNIEMPELIQVYKNQTINEVKMIISKFINSKDLVIFEKFKLLRDDMVLNECNLSDDDWIKVVKREEKTITINSIFDDDNPVMVQYKNDELISYLKKQLSEHLRSNQNDLILFYNKSCLEENKFLFELNLLHEDHIKYCLIKGTDVIEIADKVVAKGDSSEILNAFEKWSRKEIIVKRYVLNSGDDIKEKKSFINELITFQITKAHPIFLRLSNIFKDTQFLYIAMEKVGKRSIKELLIERGHLTEEEIVIFSKQILDGLKFLHNNGVIHRNLKPSNILLGDNSNIKLISFGLSKYLQGYDAIYSTSDYVNSKIVSYRYMAPEVINSESYDVKVDVWSFGVTLLELVSGKVPYAEMDDTTAMMTIGQTRRIDYDSSKISNHLKGFVDRCLKGDPKLRATVNELLQDNFLTSV